MRLEKRSLTTQVSSALIWGAGGSFVRIAMQVITQIALARMLGPDQYGIFAVGALVIGFINFFSDSGLAYGLIQKEQVVDIDIRFVFTWQLILGILASLLVAALSGLISEFFGNQDSKFVVMALSVICLLNALAAPASNILIRNLNFKIIHIARLSSYFIGYVVVGISLAFMGYGVWALVVAWIIQALTFLGIVYGTVQHPIKPLFWHSDAKTLSTYGFTVFLTNSVNWFIGNIDNIIIGRVFGHNALGLYSTTYNIIYTPTATLLGVLQPVFFSSSTKISRRFDKMASAYCAFLGLITFFILPAFVALSVCAVTFVKVVYGPLWSEMPYLLTPLTLAMPFFLLFGMSTPILWVARGAKSEVKLQVPIALFWLMSCLAASRFSSEAVAWTVLTLCIFRAAATIHMAAGALDLTFSRMWLSVRGGVLLSLVVAIVGILCNDYLSESTAQLQLIIQFAAIGSTFILCVLFFPSLFPPDLAKILLPISHHLPNWIGPIIFIFLRRIIDDKNLD